MPVNKRVMSPASSRSSELGLTDLTKVDDHQIGPEEYYEAPELVAEMLARAEVRDGDRVIRTGRPGRPRSKVGKTAISIRLSADILAAFRSTGGGWQTRLDQALREWLEVKAAGRL